MTQPVTLRASDVNWFAYLNAMGVIVDVTTGDVYSGLLLSFRINNRNGSYTFNISGVSFDIIMTDLVQIMTTAAARTTVGLGT